MHGRARFDLDWAGGAIFLVAALLICAPVAVIVQALISFASAVRWSDPSRDSTTSESLISADFKLFGLIQGPRLG